MERSIPDLFLRKRFNINSNGYKKESGYKEKESGYKKESEKKIAHFVRPLPQGGGHFVCPTFLTGKKLFNDLEYEQEKYYFFVPINSYCFRRFVPFALA